MNVRCEDSAPLNYPFGEEGQREMNIRSAPLLCSDAASTWGSFRGFRGKAAFCLFDMQP